MTDRSVASKGKRRRIIDAALRVFAARPGGLRKVAAIVLRTWTREPEILTGWVLGKLPGEDDVRDAERAVVEILVGGLERERVPVPA